MATNRKMQAAARIKRDSKASATRRQSASGTSPRGPSPRAERARKRFEAGAVVEVVPNRSRFASTRTYVSVGGTETERAKRGDRHSAERRAARGLTRRKAEPSGKGISGRSIFTVGRKRVGENEFSAQPAKPKRAGKRSTW